MVLVRDIGFVSAFWGGFSAFFSAWQLCIMQISPFFIAFSVGFYLTEAKHSKAPLKSLIVVCAGYIVVFSIVFAFLAIPRFGLSRYLFYNKETLKIGAALFVGLSASCLILFGLFKKWRINSALSLVGGILLGASLAVAYSPCITPAMSEIMNFAGKPANVMKGFYLMLAYGAGLSISFAVTGTVIALALDRLLKKNSVRNAIIVFSSLVLLGLTLLLVSGLMSSYKSFLVGFFLD
ncbi:MAG: hypothetical protein IME96_10265 [Proteobacteria bacterium]|nr:hypothetical protein [Pseudomonadota bacterium]